MNAFQAGTFKQLLFLVENFSSLVELVKELNFDKSCWVLRFAYFRRGLVILMDFL
jgi:hypothetical protein